MKTQNKLSVWMAIFTVLILLPFHCSGQGNKLKQQVENITCSKKATIGVAIISIEDNDTIIVNGSFHYPMQSTYKFQLALAVLDQIDKGRFALDQEILIKKENLFPDTYSPLRDKYPDGNVRIPIREILTYTVSQSDNNGCDILFGLIGGTKEADRYIRGLGIEGMSIAATEEEMHTGWDTQFANWTTPLASACLLGKFYNNEILSAGNRKFLWETMVSTATGPNRIKGLLPDEAVVAHKTGSGPTRNGVTSACNDMGIIVLPNGKHIVVAVFIANSEESNTTNERIIAEIAKAAWNHYDSSNIR